MRTKSKAPLTFNKMKGIISYFTALIKERRQGVTALPQRFGGIVPVDQQTDGSSVRPEVGLCDESAAAAHLNFTASPQELHIVSAADFQYLKVIGTGSFGKVLLAKHRKSNRHYAVKVLQKNIILERGAKEDVVCEHNVLLKTPNHPFIVKLHCSFQTRERLYLVLDYAGGGELFYHLQRERVFTESRARFYAAELTCALGFLHSLHIVYRDLKPENILLDATGHVVLTDFGLCKEGVAARSTTKTFCGTPEYLAPEVLRLQEYDHTVDWWAFGVVLHEMLYGLPPFYSADRIKMLSNIIHQPLILKAGVSKTGRDLLKRLLNKDRAKRLGAKHDMLELQRHSFFSAIHWEELEARKIPPPFIPSLSGPDDLSNINPAFTKLPVPESLAGCEEPDGSFQGFSYTRVEISSSSTQMITDDDTEPMQYNHL